MTRRLKPHELKARAGRARKLTLEQQQQVNDWHEAVTALGSKEDHLKAAGLAWERKRRELPNAKRLAAELGICAQTLSHYKLKRHNHDRIAATSQADGLPADVHRRHGEQLQGTGVHGVAVAGHQEKRRHTNTFGEPGRFLRAGV